MDSRRFLLVICIILFEHNLHYVHAIHDRALRKLNLRIQKLESSNQKRINDLEFDIRTLRIELAEQTIKADELESRLNSTDADAGESQGKNTLIFVIAF